MGEVHPLSLHYLSETGISTNELSSQSWDDFEDWHPDVVITVCDSAAGETCPVWFGRAIQAHWGLVDPSKLVDSEEDIAQAFRHTIELLAGRINLLLDENVEHLNQMQQKELLDQIGVS